MTLQEIQELAGHREVAPWIVKLVGDAVTREREECMKLVLNLVLDHPGRAELTALQCAAAIRARGNNAA